MRRSILLLSLASAACSPSTSSRSAPDTANAAAVASVPTDPRMRHAESRDSQAAKQAQAVVVRYFELIDRGDFPAARGLWAHDGAESGGSAKDLGAFYANYSRYLATVGAPTDIHVADGRQYVNVAVKTRVTIARTGKRVEQEGPLMLRRSIDPNTPDVQERNWQIWGADIRVPH